MYDFDEEYREKMRLMLLADGDLISVAFFIAGLVCAILFEAYFLGMALFVTGLMGLVQSMVLFSSRDLGRPLPPGLGTRLSQLYARFSKKD